MLSTDKQTDRQTDRRQTNQRYQKHNLLCQGGKKSFRTLPAPRSGYATTIIVFIFANLLILEYQITTKM